MTYNLTISLFAGFMLLGTSTFALNSIGNAPQSVSVSQSAQPQADAIMRSL